MMLNTESGATQQAFTPSSRRNFSMLGGPAYCVDLADQWLAAGGQGDVIKTWDFTGALEAEARATAAKAARNSRRKMKKRANIAANLANNAAVLAPEQSGATWKDGFKSPNANNHKHNNACGHHAASQSSSHHAGFGATADVSRHDRASISSLPMPHSADTAAPGSSTSNNPVSKQSRSAPQLVPHQVQRRNGSQYGCSPRQYGSSSSPRVQHQYSGYNNSGAFIFQPSSSQSGHWPCEGSSPRNWYGANHSHFSYRSCSQRQQQGTGSRLHAPHGVRHARTAPQPQNARNTVSVGQPTGSDGVVPMAISPSTDVVVDVHVISLQQQQQHPAPSSANRASQYHASARQVADNHRWHDSRQGFMH